MMSTNPWLLLAFNATSEGRGILRGGVVVATQIQVKELDLSLFPFSHKMHLSKYPVGDV